MLRIMFVFLWCNSVPDPFIVEVSRSHNAASARAHKHIHTLLGNDQLFAEINSSDDAHAISWVRTRVSSNRETLDLRLERHGYRVRLNICYRHENKSRQHVLCYGHVANVILSMKRKVTHKLHVNLTFYLIGRPSCM